MTDPKIEAAVKRLCKRARWSTAGSHAAAIEAELLAARDDGAREAVDDQRLARFLIERGHHSVVVDDLRSYFAARAAERETGE